MGAFTSGWRIQVRVIGALMMRELTTRFGRENIGFLWIMAEPLLFASLVGLMWTFMKGYSEHGVNVMAFTVSGYIPLTLLRSGLARCAMLFTVNGGLMYHSQIKIIDFVFVRFFIECIGAMLAYFFIALLLITVGVFPVPSSIGFMLLGWLYYCIFVLSLCFMLAPLSEISEAVEKVLPVVTYIMIPFSGTFNLTEWLSPQVQAVVAYSPPVHGMEMMRYGIFGDIIHPHFDYVYPLGFSMVLLCLGLALCRYVRRELVVE